MVQINIFSPLMDRYGTVSIDLYSIGHLYTWICKLDPSPCQANLFLKQGKMGCKELKDVPSSANLSVLVARCYAWSLEFSPRTKH